MSVYTRRADRAEVGDKYHTSKCLNVQEHYWETNEEVAQELGYELCEWCENDQLGPRQQQVLETLESGVNTLPGMSSELGISRERLSGVVNRLVHRGLVSRRTSASDARMTVYEVEA